MKNFILKGNILNYPATGNIASGEGVLVGTKLGVAQKAAVNGETVALAMEGVFQLPKVAPQVIAQGAAVYWDNTAKNITTTASGNTIVGYAFDAALSAETVVNVKLNG